MAESLYTPGATTSAWIEEMADRDYSNYRGQQQAEQPSNRDFDCCDNGEQGSSADGS